MHWNTRRTAIVAGSICLLVLALVANRMNLLALTNESTASLLANLPDYYNYNDTLIVENATSPDSFAVTNYFLQQRAGIPGIGSSNVVQISVSPTESVTRQDYLTAIKKPLEDAIISHNTLNPQHPINYIILTKGVPLFIADFATSVDSELAACLGKENTKNCATAKLSLLNPYYNSHAKFSHAAFGMYIVTRLDGYSTQDIKRLIERSANTAIDPISTLKAQGLFVLDSGGITEEFDPALIATNQLLQQKGFKVTFDKSSTFLARQKNVLGYWSLGSNADKDPSKPLHAIPGNSWENGAIAETAVSTSARTFSLPPSYGQSLIADLIGEGVSGVKGYVSEPLSSAIANPLLLFDHYTAGYNMADSFYAASQVMHWKDVVVGDPKMVIVKNSNPIGTFPLNGAFVSPLPTFRWIPASSDYSGGITKNQLWIDGKLKKDNSPREINSITVSSPLSVGTHTWFIRALDAQGNALFSDPGTFRVAR